MSIIFDYNAHCHNYHLTASSCASFSIYLVIMNYLIRCAPLI